MFFSFSFISSVFFVSAVLADRRRDHHRSKFMDRVDQSGDVESKNIQYSPNWAGAVLSERAGTFNYVTGTFTVPVPSGGTDSIASAWVGIDGSTCQNAILQTGVDFVPDGQGGGSYQAWYEWFPDVSYYFSDITIYAGDTVTLTVHAHSSTSGIAEITSSRGQSKQMKLSSEYALCGQDAEWIVEDPSDIYGDLFPLANFGTVTFQHSHAGYNDENYSPRGATIYDMQQNGNTFTRVTIDGASVTVTYSA